MHGDLLNGTTLDVGPGGSQTVYVHRQCHKLGLFLFGKVEFLRFFSGSPVG